MVSNGIVGQRVRALKKLGGVDDVHSPWRIYAKAGDILVIRKVRPANKPAGWWAYAVSHEDVTDSSFRVSEGEIEDAGGERG
jgi:hypothetical protein